MARTERLPSTPPAKLLDSLENVLTCSAAPWMTLT